MATPWDRAAPAYLDEWLPRFSPYYLDLITELALPLGGQVLVACAGAGAEALAAARVVGEGGRVRATDASEALLEVCREQASRAKFGAIEVARADAAAAAEGRAADYDAVVCAFGLWHLADRAAALRAWGEALAPAGKVGILTWGPPEAQDPFELLASSLREVEPGHAVPDARIGPQRSAIAGLFAEAGLSLVRHTVVRHTMAFRSADAFLRAAREGCIWREVSDALGEATFAQVAAAFFAKVGGPTAPLSFEAPATMAIGARPFAEVTLESRPSVRAEGLPSEG